MYSQDKLTYRNARLVSTPLLDRVLKQKKYPVGATKIADLVADMEIEARLAASRFTELGRIIAKIHGSEDITDIMLRQEYYNLRDMFLFLPPDMVADYFDELEQSFLEMLKEHVQQKEELSPDDN